MSIAALLKEFAANPGAVLAWEVEGLNLSVFRVEGGAEQLALTRVPRADRATLRAELTKLGYAQGQYASEADFVWLRDEHSFVVWDAKGQALRADAEALTFAKATVTRAPGMEVVAFVDDDLIRRGVLVRSASGEHKVAVHIELRAGAGDGSYGPLDALGDCGWTVALGRALADFLGATFVDKTGSP